MWLSGVALAAELDGAALYERYCALCHGADRGGYAADQAPSLRSPELLTQAPASFLWQAVAYGRPGTAMAAFADDQGGPMDHAAMHALMEWLLAGVERTPVADAPVVGDIVRGQAVYAASCASCHGASGEGGIGTALGHPVFLATASDAFIRATILSGRSGTPMPGFQEQLSSSDIDAVTAFLRTRASGWTAPPRQVVEVPDPAEAVLNPSRPPADLAVRRRRFVAADDVARALGDQRRMVLLDARPRSDWQRGHLPGALPVPFYDGIEGLIPHLPRDGTPIVAYCACPHAASGKVVDALRDAGFRHAYILDEGVLVWAARQYPLATARAEVP